jgi:pyruvate kinase
MRKTKIICTIGPSVDSEEAIRSLILGGMDAARFNFSHGTHESHLAQLEKLRKVRRELNRPVAAILDTKGPEIRIRTFEKSPVTLEAGAEFTLTTEDVPGDGRLVSVTYADLHEELKPGCKVLIDDGLIELIVTGIRGREIVCRVETGGELSNNKSINLPDTQIRLPSLTQGDIEDLRFAVEQDFDFIAASFVRSATDVEDIRRVLRGFGGENIPIIAKVENGQGVNHLEDIVDTADGVMVARGDLGVEIPAYEVPVVQKRIIADTLRQGKIVIIATQMLDSMIRNPRPTRAEISDVANAVFDGASCVMLSGETAAGKYPMEALETMAETVMAAETATDYWDRFRKANFPTSTSVTDAISHGCCLTAMDLNASAILTATKKGITARMISRYRPACPIAAFTESESVRRKLALSWGVEAYLTGGPVVSTDRLFCICAERAREEGVVSPGQIVVITAGVPVGKSGSTNLIKVQPLEENFCAL